MTLCQTDGPLCDVVYDVLIIGAGVVGCALARRLTLAGAKVVIVDKAPDVLDGASKGNSAILHTGFDAPPGSLEQRCIAEGYREYRQIHQSLGLPRLETGALVLAWNPEELQALDRLIVKAHENQVHDIERLERADILRLEPHLCNSVLGGFRVPGEHIIDAWTSAHAYLLQALANGATLYRSSEVVTGEFRGSQWQLHTSRGSLNARHVINAAGLYGDKVDSRLIGKSLFSITPRKGQFVVFEKSASRLTKHILLPVPSAKTKGIVVCRTIYGNLLVGPTAQDQESRSDSSTDAQTLQTLRQKGQLILPALARHDTTATYAGLRPATEFTDYQINHAVPQHYISVGGIRSTGLSASLGIARYVTDKLMQSDTIKFNPVLDARLPVVERLSNYHRRDWQNPGNRGIVCHCELVTRREILSVLNGPLPPVTLAGLKRRTRVGMGQCQGYYCSAEVADLTRDRLIEPIAS